jgi:hypothetical protein
MESEFFPSVTAIRKAIEQVSSEGQEMTGAYRDYEKPSESYHCVTCRDTGYVYVPQGQSNRTAVTRCQCRRPA